MKFVINFKSEKVISKLFYIKNEFSFIMVPHLRGRNFGIAINTLDLPVVDNKILEVTGYCPLIMKTNIDVPEFHSGSLKVLDEKEYGFNYKLNKKEDWLVYHNNSTGWICIGNPEIREKGVEFINNFVAILSGDQLVALWLKPTFIDTPADLPV